MLIAVFAGAAAVSLLLSAILVSRLERVGDRLGASEALLGLLAALAADAPEITAAVAAIASGRGAVGLGVALGSNVFNLAALLGLSAVVAGRIRMDRRVIELEGLLALSIAAVAVLVVGGELAVPAGLGLVLAVFLPYVAISAVRPDGRAGLPIPGPLRRWLAGTMQEEESELALAIHPTPGGTADAMIVAVAIAVVVAASFVMEQAATELGSRSGVPDIVVGGLVLAAVTSLPNAVAAVHLASRGRGQATLSTALNSNAVNVLVGFMLPATIAGLAAFSGNEVFVASAFLVLTAASLLVAWLGRGLGRRSGAAIIAGYVLFAALLAVR
jgi:cation:H+ antiporter